LTLLWMLAFSVASSGCHYFLGGFGRRADPAILRPPPEVLQSPLPGEDVAAASEAEGIWSISNTENRVSIEGGPVVPMLYYALHLKIESDGTYELVYQAYWGTRDSSDPNMRAIDVREAGRVSFANRRMRLEPQATTVKERRPGGVEVNGPLANETREYRVALERAYLNLGGRCAQYQVEPICRQPREIWYSLRAGVTEWPIPPLKFPGR